MISFENVNKFILTDVNLHIPKGVVVGVIGASGAGKTTLLKLACGLLDCSAGNVWTFHKNPVKNRRQLASCLRAYFSDIPLFQGDDTVCNQFQVFQAVYRLEQAAYWEAYKVLAEQFRFTEYERKQITQLSLGQRRRVELAAMLLGNAELFVFDEPTNGLDERGKGVFWQQLKRKKEDGATILVSSHNMAEVEYLCDRILLLDQGRILYYGDRERLMKRYAPINGIELQFKGGIPDMDDLPLIKYSIDDNILKLQYNSNHISAAEIVKKILDQTTISRIRTIRPELADVIIQRKENMKYESYD